VSFCLAAAGVAMMVAAESFTLSWTHTVERTEWREDWRVEGGRLVLEAARVKGSGAGVDPPPAARLVDGFYVWDPKLALTQIVLRRDPHAGDWRLCAAGRCASLAAWLGRDAEPVRLFPATPEGCNSARGL
jgi:hypothetical protein